LLVVSIGKYMLFFCINQQNHMIIVRQHQNVKTTSSKIAMPVLGVLWPTRNYVICQSTSAMIG